MRTMLLGGLALAVMTGLWGCGEAPEPVAESEEEPAEAAPAEPKALDVEGVAARLAAGEDITLLDVRTPEELEEDGAIEGYLHIPIDDLQARLAEVPKDKPIVAY